MTSGSSHVFGKLPEVIPPKAFAVEGKRLPLEELYNYTVRAQYGHSTGGTSTGFQIKKHGKITGEEEFFHVFL